MAASRSWKTLFATYQKETNSSTTEITFAAEQNGRVAIRGASGDSTCIWTDSSIYFVRKDHANRRFAAGIDVKSMVRLARTVYTQVTDMSGVGPTAADPPLRWTMFWDCQVDMAGNAGLVLSYYAHFGEEPLFGWLERLRGGAGVTVSAEAETFVSDGPEGRYEIDRRTGLLRGCRRVPPLGTSVSLTLTKLEVDGNLSPDLFEIPADLSPPSEVRRFFSQYFLRTVLFQALEGELDLSVRSTKCIAVVAALYELLWTKEERERVAGIARRRIQEEAAKLKAVLPNAPEEAIWEQACVGATKSVVDEVLQEILEDFRMFQSTTLVTDPVASEKLWADFGSKVTDSLIRPIAEMAKRR